MTETEPGAINKPNLIEECQMAIFDLEHAARHDPYGLMIVSTNARVMAVIGVLRSRGLLNELGLEIIQRDTK